MPELPAPINQIILCILHGDKHGFEVEPRIKSIFIFLFVIFCWKSVGIFNVQFPENVIVKCCFSELWTIRKMLKLWRQYTVSVHSLNTQSQYTLSVHSLSTQSQYTVSVHSVSTQYKVNTEHVWNERSTDLKVHWIVVNFAKNLFTYKVKKSVDLVEVWMKNEALQCVINPWNVI